MNLNRIMVVCAFALGGLAVGCGDKCGSVCSDLKKCPDGTTFKPSVDCDKFCDDTDKLADDASCKSQKDDYLDCADGQKDVCSMTDTSCSDKRTALASCVTAYCVQHSTDAVCTNFEADIPGLELSISGGGN